MPVTILKGRPSRHGVLLVGNRRMAVVTSSGVIGLSKRSCWEVLSAVKSSDSKKPIKACSEGTVQSS